LIEKEFVPVNISGKTFLVTGGSSGLGAACVRELSGAGSNVVIVDIGEHGAALAAEIGARVRFAKADVTDEAQVEAAIALAQREFGGLDGAVNCAGIATAERAVGKNGPQPLAHFTKVVAVNLIGTFNVIRLAAAQMMQRATQGEEDRGVFVCTASVAAFDGQIGQAAYSASKGGIVGMTLPLAREFAQAHIRVCSIAPGIFDTPMLAGLPEAARESLGKQTPFPARLGRPAEYALLARHIMENQMLNGEVIRLDGAIRLAPR
jgi:NAD(P)-dependent dehydrogenase (short-subunit alcohol dehydrogenase family)